MGVSEYSLGGGITATGSAVQDNALIAQYSPDGSASWAYAVTGTSATNYLSSSALNAVAVSADGSEVFVGGVITDVDTYDFHGVSITGSRRGFPTRPSWSSSTPRGPAPRAPRSRAQPTSRGAARSQSIRTAMSMSQLRGISLAPTRSATTSAMADGQAVSLGQGQVQRLPPGSMGADRHRDQRSELRLHRG